MRNGRHAAWGSLAAAASVLLLAACELPVPVTPCHDEDDCPDGYRCHLAHGYCLAHDASPGDGAGLDGAGLDGTRVDGAVADGASADGAEADGAMADGAMVDGASADGTSADGATADGSMPDGAMPDGAMPDGAMPDGATADAATADTAMLDTSTPDAPFTDAPHKDASSWLPDRFRSDRIIVRLDGPLYADLPFLLDRNMPLPDGMLDCGSAGLPCCYGMECDQWSTCNAPGEPANVCVACGEAEGDCCPDGSCRFGFTCSGQRCRNECGAEGQPCCDQFECGAGMLCCTYPTDPVCQSDPCPY